MANHKKMYWYRNGEYTIDELSEMSGISVSLIRNRLSKGYSIEQSLQDIPIYDSILAFAQASHWEDWIGLSSEQLYQQYWDWCLKNGLNPVTHRILSTQLLPMYGLHTVSMTYGNSSRRYIRQKQFRDEFGRLI